MKLNSLNKVNRCPTMKMKYMSAPISKLRGLKPPITLNLKFNIAKNRMSENRSFFSLEKLSAKFSVGTSNWEVFYMLICHWLRLAT